MLPYTYFLFPSLQNSSERVGVATSKLVKTDKDLIDTWSNPYVDLVFVCKICRKTQPHRCNWKRHFLSHSQDRKFNCQHCGKKFKTNDNLKTHLNTHLNVKFDPAEDMKGFIKLE